MAQVAGVLGHGVTPTSYFSKGVTMATPAERSAHARMAANYRWAREPDRYAATAAARAASPAAVEYFFREVDPDERLSYAERVRRAESARKAYWQARALRMRQAKARKAELRERANKRAK